jgi:hypothetical protein
MVYPVDDIFSTSYKDGFLQALGFMFADAIPKALEGVCAGVQEFIKVLVSFFGDFFGEVWFYINPSFPVLRSFLELRQGFQKLDLYWSYVRVVFRTHLGSSVVGR